MKEKTITILLSPPIPISFPDSPFNCVGCINFKGADCTERDRRKNCSTEHAN